MCTTYIYMYAPVRDRFDSKSFNGCATILSQQIFEV